MLEARGDGVDGSGDVREFGGDGGCYARVLGVDDAEHLEGGEGVDVFGGGVAGFGGEGGKSLGQSRDSGLHGSSIMAQPGGMTQWNGLN